MIPQNVYEVMTKVFTVIEKDPTKLTHLPPEYCGKDDERAFTVENLENIACNHLFDDNSKAFNITELEGCIIRHYFSAGAETYEYVKDLRQKFPNFFKHPESQKYLDSVNVRRKKCGLDPISL